MLIFVIFFYPVASANFSHRLSFNLTNTFSCDIEFLTDFIKRTLMVITYTIAKTKHLLFSICKSC